MHAWSQTCNPPLVSTSHTLLPTGKKQLAYTYIRACGLLGHSNKRIIDVQVHATLVALLDKDSRWLHPTDTKERNYEPVNKGFQLSTLLSLRSIPHFRRDGQNHYCGL